MMYGHNIDPLADSAPARYAYESDDEDILNSDPQTKTEASPTVEVTFLPSDVYKKDEGNTLVVATGDVGGSWARGANLGEQAGQINVNKRAIGFIFRPIWAARARITVIVSEALTRLPTWAMHTYADTILESWQPSRIIFLDSYSSSTYISAAPILPHEAPLRYLSTDRRTIPENDHLSPFAPPNLLQSTTSAFLALLALPKSVSMKASGLTILVPTQRVPIPDLHIPSHPEDDQVTPTKYIPNEAVDSGDWDIGLLCTAHRVIFESIGGNHFAEWEDVRKTIGGTKGTLNRPKPRSSGTNGGMYI